MRRRRAIRFGALWAFAGLAAGLGCTHNHYYTMPAGAVVPGAAIGPCDTGPVVTTTPTVGAICDEPTYGQPSVAQNNGVRTTPIVSNAARPIGQPRPIYSQPSGRADRRSGMLTWRASGGESLATTRIEGAADDDTTIK